jgi:hypothetical protein
LQKISICRRGTRGSFILRLSSWPKSLPKKKHHITEEERRKRLREAAREHETSNDPKNFREGIQEDCAQALILPALVVARGAGLTASTVVVSPHTEFRIRVAPRLFR